MNLRRKSRAKLKIFGSFSGSKSRLFKSETDLTSDPVLLGIKHHGEDQEVKYINRINRHTSLLASSDQKLFAAPPSRSFSMCHTKPMSKLYEVRQQLML